MENWLRLQDKVVIVTGGAGGIGHAVAEEFLADGAKVAVCDIKADPRNFKGAGKDNFLYVKADVRSKEQVDAMAAEVLKRFGTIDVLVNNAGVNIPRLLVDEAGKYELDDAEIPCSFQYATSNEPLPNKTAAVSVREGRLLLICDYE